MTNLALKGIIGVKAMAEISQALGQKYDAQLYNNYAASLAASWVSLAMSSSGDRLLGSYDDEQSWALMYNLYADRLLQTGVVEQTVNSFARAFYTIINTAAAPQFGLPLDSDAGNVSNVAWLLFTAGTVLDDDVRDGLVNSVWARASFNQTTGPFPDTYDIVTGAIQGSPNANAG
ncbi:uncharacterized protein TRAVEDRAFT_114260 [Trametes versicolor FP-101664 SS1]|uniref:uncharacterized protein n=1 Tax=Trametes versicolor (strain FP-101664) TaxID=717944 RepID=UPI0004621F77|nr:uncharacterized protein TRAVEDRAFT_114260 [Trametes versicolor FP-101664 SS1]EIW62877.1 hypothetical protein TRAVEDRAFT_114260 [Trametes versicolor FP-101664 SS1]